MDKWFAISLNHKLFSILLFLILYVKAPQIGNVFFVLIMKTQATRDALFVGLLIALLAVKKGKKKLANYIRLNIYDSARAADINW